MLGDGDANEEDWVSAVESESEVTEPSVVLHSMLEWYADHPQQRWASRHWEAQEGQRQQCCSGEGSCWSPHADLIPAGGKFLCHVSHFRICNSWGSRVAEGQLTFVLLRGDVHEGLHWHGAIPELVSWKKSMPLQRESQWLQGCRTLWPHPGGLLSGEAASTSGSGIASIALFLWTGP
jgi:hypothetical protein